MLEFVLGADVSIPMAEGIAEGPALLMGILKEKMSPQLVAVADVGG